MIIVCSQDNVQYVECDEVWVIMRSPGGLPPRLLHDPRTSLHAELSPSLDLLSWTIQQKRKFRFSQEMFDQEYVPRFLEEIRTQTAREALNHLYAEQKKKCIALVCSCRTESLCHRSILAGLFVGAGCEVTNENRQNMDKYRKYWEQWKEGYEWK